MSEQDNLEMLRRYFIAHKERENVYRRRLELNEWMGKTKAQLMETWQSLPVWDIYFYEQGQNETLIGSGLTFMGCLARIPAERDYKIADYPVGVVGFRAIPSNIHLGDTYPWFYNLIAKPEFIGDQSA